MGNSIRELLISNPSALEGSGLSQSWCGFLVDAISYCLATQGHDLSVEMCIYGDITENCILMRAPLDELAQRSWADLQEATEYGAYGIAILLILEYTNHTGVERSCKGTGFDYWLGMENSLLFQRRARLEVSGILKGSSSAIDYRLEQKIEQISCGDYSLPSFIVIVEFSSPRSKVRKNG